MEEGWRVLDSREKLLERAGTWFLFAWGTRYVHSFLLVSHYSLIFHNIMLFWVDVEGHQSACWYVCLHLCRFVHLLIWYAPVVVMKCLRIMRVVASVMVHPPAQKIHRWFMKWIFWDFPLFICLLLRSFFSTSLVSWRPSWYGSIFSSLLERDPRKHGVVVMAAKLTSSASPYPFSFVIRRFIQYAYIPIVYPPTSLSRSSYSFPRSSLQESSILHHTHLSLVHSPSHSLAYMEFHGCMPSFTPSHIH